MKDKMPLIIVGGVIGIVLLICIISIVSQSVDDRIGNAKNTISSTNTVTNTVKPTSSNTKENTVKQNTVNENVIENKEDNGMYLSGKQYANIEIKNFGTIKLELDADVAPITVTNFMNLVEKGFYNGLTFHRIIDGFMMQGGDPLGTGNGGSDEKIKGEFTVNGVKNNITHVRGTISMARAGYSYDSASSQFFIVHKDSTFLDGQYAGFGKVLEGMDIVDKICSTTPVEDSNGKVLKENQPIIEKIVKVK